jgi:hypothetical protein
MGERDPVFRGSTVTSIKRRIALVKMRLTGHATYKVSGGRAEMWRNDVVPAKYTHGVGCQCKIGEMYPNLHRDRT